MGQGLVATAFASALKGQPLNIFGDGSATRDYIHAQDIAEGLLALIKRGKLGEIYNVGTTQGVALQTLIDEHINPIAGADGFRLACEYLPARSTDVAYNVLANTKLESHTGFSPKIDLDRGLRETWAWIKQLGNLGRSTS
jgi:UDP-glucose 4-epimerase